MSTPEALLTTSQAAQRLGMHPRTVRDLCASRQITCIVTTGPKGQARYRIQPSALEAFLREHTVTRRLS
ncbi:MAG: helix-turn-helix domain-containing protein [Cutibacterium avidum]|nr:helix-turn-helix domain-containing protein [Cutibacterium avidum]